MFFRLTAATHQTDCNRTGRPRGDVAAICLEHDVVTQGRDQHESIVMLKEAIALLVHDSQERGVDPMSELRGPPPAEEIAMFTGPRISFEVETDDYAFEWRAVAS